MRHALLLTSDPVWSSLTCVETGTWTAFVSGARACRAAQVGHGNDVLRAASRRPSRLHERAAPCDVQVVCPAPGGALGRADGALCCLDPAVAGRDVDVRRRPPRARVDRGALLRSVHPPHPLCPAGPGGPDMDVRRRAPLARVDWCPLLRHVDPGVPRREVDIGGRPPLARVDRRPGLPLPWLERSVPADVQIRGVAPSGRGGLGRWRLLLDGAVGLEVEVGGQAPLAVGRPPLRLARGKRAVGPEMQVGGAVQANVGELQLARTQASSS
mmetsp:Transcript_25901/g.77344  ORF Transcript_25901/g.77344 Transcript_25901/m.77344 type:complete len:270 (+) Transcript_25901:470-1279(+)